MKRILYDIVIILLIGVLAFSGWHLFQIWQSYHKGTSTYEKIRDEAVTEDNSTQEDTGESGAVPTNPPITVDWDKLRAVNSQVVGYIYDEGTQINYPVLQGDNNDQYLHHLMDGTYNSSGSIFMDSGASPDLSDKRTLIYGHHMKNGSMFAALHQYRDQDFYDEHPYMWYLTPSGNYRLDLLAGYVVDPDDDIYQQDFQSQEELDSFLTKAKSSSDFTPLNSYENGGVSRIIVLSTCAYEYNDARYIVICVPVPVS